VDVRFNEMSMHAKLDTVVWKIKDKKAVGLEGFGYEEWVIRVKTCLKRNV
jgi:hypothetical protein